MNYSRLIIPATALMLLASAIPASAQSVASSVGITATVDTNAINSSAHVHANASTTRGANEQNGQDRMQKGQALGKTEIDGRVKALQALSVRIGSMQRLSAGEIASLQASLSAQIASLQSLETTITGDTSTTSLKADVTSITKSFRVYMLVMPQAQIAAAADRELTIAGQMQNLSAKFSTRIDAAAAAGTDVTALRAALADMNAKVADATAQANAAVSASVNLKPDNGDATVAASNTASLKDARAKLDAARSGLIAAYKDAQTIQVGIKGKGVVTASSTPNRLPQHTEGSASGSANAQ